MRREPQDVMLEEFYPKDVVAPPRAVATQVQVSRLLLELQL